jgi:hypothetical protein
MAGITLAQCEAQLALWLEADAAVATNQSYSIKDRSLTRADAAEITRKIDYWNGKVQQLTRAASGIRRTRYVVNE